MKTKELKNLAKKIAKLELIIQSSSDDIEIKHAQDEIIKLTSHVQSLEDIVLIDEFIMDILDKEKKES